MTTEQMVQCVQALNRYNAITDEQALCVLACPYVSEADQARVRRMVLELVCQPWRIRAPKDPS